MLPFSVYRNNKYPYSDSSNSVNVRLLITTLRERSQCLSGTTPKFCILIERLPLSNINQNSSRYVEIPVGTLWVDRNGCTRCSCKTDGRLTCEFLYETCNQPCLVHKPRHIPVLYYFPSGSTWITPLKSKCRSCTCLNGQRRCINCDPILKIAINTKKILKSKENQKQSAVDRYGILSSVSSSIRTRPCLLQINVSSHQLILSGQKVWFKNRCYFCSKQYGGLISC